MPKILPHVLFKYRGSCGPIADEIWRGIGEVDVFVDSFCGRVDSLFYKEAKPDRKEIIGDINPYIVNLFRALQQIPDTLSDLVDQDPISNIEVIARDHWLHDNKNEIVKIVLDGGYNLRAAHFWLYRQCLVIEAGSKHKRLTRVTIARTCACYDKRDNKEFFRTISQRLKNVIINYGDFSETVKLAQQSKKLTYGYYFGPPYTYEAKRRMGIYQYDCGFVGLAAFDEACRLGKDFNCRVVFQGFEGEYFFPKDWVSLAWTSPRASKDNKGRERVWFSPACDYRNKYMMAHNLA